MADDHRQLEEKDLPAPPQGRRLASLRGTATTRGGAQKMKFAPTVPTRRNKKEVKPSLLEENAAGGSRAGSIDRGGRGRGRERGGRKVESNTLLPAASGPFAFGPSTATSSRSSRLKSDYGEEGISSVIGAITSSCGYIESPTGQDIRMMVALEEDEVETLEESFSGNGTGDMLFPFAISAPCSVENKDAKTETLITPRIKSESDDRNDHLQDLMAQETEASFVPEIVHDFLTAALNGKDRLLFFQFPHYIPQISMQQAGAEQRKDGRIGKLRVYRSGRISMQVGNLMLEVRSAGTSAATGAPTSFQQQVAVVDTANKQAFIMGNVWRRLICTPNLQSLFTANSHQQ